MLVLVVVGLGYDGLEGRMMLLYLLLSEGLFSLRSLRRECSE